MRASSDSFNRKDPDFMSGKSLSTHQRHVESLKLNRSGKNPVFEIVRLEKFYGIYYMAIVYVDV